MAENEAGPEGFGYDVAEKAYFIYADDKPDPREGGYIKITQSDSVL